MRYQPRSYIRSSLPKVQELLDQGETQAEISKETSVATRTLSRLLRHGWLRRPSLSPTSVVPVDSPERGLEQKWTARTLLELGMDPAEAVRILLLLERTAAVSTPRFREWLSTYISLAAEVPDEWAATVAFLPILGRDLCNPALGTLAELMHESVPWEDELLRSRYGSLAKPLLLEARIEFHDWLFFVSNTEMVPELPLAEAAVILEALRRCPHVDRPVRRREPVHEEDKMFGLHFVREMPMGALTLSWSRLLDREPPWLEEYGDYARKFTEAAGEQKSAQDPHGTRLVQVETVVAGRRSWPKWPRGGALWDRGS